MISPFSRGGHIDSERFDHTSQLKFLEPASASDSEHVEMAAGNRRRSDLDIVPQPHEPRLPKLPDVALTPFALSGSCEEVGEESEVGGIGPSLPTKQRMPTQRGVTIDASRFFKESKTSTDRIPLRSGRNTATTKSAYNHLTHGGEPAEHSH